MMNSKFVYTIFALGLLIIMSSSQAQSKDYKLELLDFNPIDLCGKEFQKEVIVAPSIGNIIKSDSLIGFELSLGYDPEIVRMNKVLYINTFADRFKFKQSYTESETGEIVFEGAVGLQGQPNPLSGDMPLVGFAGDFIGDCDDSVEFTVNYFFPLDGFKGSVDEDTTLTIVGNIVDKPTRMIGFKFDNTDLKLKKDSTALLNIDLDLGELSSLEYWKAKVSFDTDSLTLVGVEGSDSVEVELNYADNTGYFIEMKVINADDANITLNIASAKYDTADVKVTIETVETTECICATRFPESIKIFNNYQSDTVVTNVDYSDSYEYLDGRILAKKVGTVVQVYDILGNKIDEEVCNVNSVYDSNRLRKGIYFIKVTTSDLTKIYKKINN